MYILYIMSWITVPPLFFITIYKFSNFKFMSIIRFSYNTYIII